MKSVSDHYLVEVVSQIQDLIKYKNNSITEQVDGNPQLFINLYNSEILQVIPYTEGEKPETNTVIKEIYYFDVNGLQEHYTNKTISETVEIIRSFC